MLKLIVTKDIRVRLSLTIASCISVSIRSGTTFPVDSEGYIPLLSCGFEMLVKPISVLAPDSYEIIDTRLLSGKDNNHA